MLGAVIFLQKMGVVNEYLTTVDKAGDSSSDGPNLVREVSEGAEAKSEYGSCGSDGPKSSSSSSSSLDDDDDDDDDDDNDMMF